MTIKGTLKQICANLDHTIYDGAYWFTPDEYYECYKKWFGQSHEQVIVWKNENGRVVPLHFFVTPG
jgi:MoaA/NifB/PqqE/SkfB family radical SAM enzyme